MLTLLNSSHLIPILREIVFSVYSNIAALSEEVMLEYGKRVSEATLDSYALKRRRIEGRRPARTLSYVSKSHAFSNIKTQNRIERGAEFFFPLVPMLFQSTAFKTAAPSSDEDENSAHHPYFLLEAAKLVKSAKRAKMQIQQQTYWTKSGQWLKLDDGTAAGVEPDFCTTNVFDKKALVRNPDDGVQVPHSKYEVALVLEQKKTFVEADQIEAIDYGERLLSIQRGREVVYTALFYCHDNEKVIRWLETRETNNQFHTRVSRPASLAPGGVGQNQLLTMLTKTSKQLGLDFPLVETTNGSIVHIQSVVGQGATSTVYAATLDEKAGVLKLLKPEFKHLARHEAQVLDRLKNSSVVGAPSSFTVVSDQALFFFETLDHIERLSKLHKTGLLQCLQGAHAAGVIHRDLRPDNLMENPSDGSVRLIDWGFAYMVDDESNHTPSFEGTFRYAGDEALASAIANHSRRPKKKDDLQSFVRTVLSLTYVALQHELADVETLQGARDFWSERRKESTLYEPMFAAAESCEYAALEGIMFS